MNENVIIVNCKVPGEAYQILTMLRQKPEGKGFKVTKGAIIKRDNGKPSLLDGFATEGTEEERSWTGGIIGGLVGLLAGPVGTLVGSIGGILLANIVSMRERNETASLLKKVHESLGDGDAAVVLLVEEETEAALAEKLKDFQISLTRMDAKKVATEIEKIKKYENARKVKENETPLYAENKPITDGNYDRSLAVKCVNGTFVGKRRGDVIAYKGIPFVGKQPVGEYRWKAPVEFAPDDGIYEAYYGGKSPCQNPAVIKKAPNLIYQGEDCLNLNIWKAEASDTKAKPIMVWIHGGAFEIGSIAEPWCDGTNFIQENQDVILVSVEYRLNIFGFFHLSHLPDGKEYPDAQNLGLMDQLMALKWIHENIAFFGGDPDNVTIFGESAGGGSVTLLPLVEGSHKYFRRVIAQSGSPSLSQTAEESIECTNKVMEKLGCRTVADLQKIDTGTLVATAGSLLSLRTGPERDGRFLPLNPYEAYANGAAKDIDILTGCNKDEFNYFVSEFGEERFIEWGTKRKAEKLAQMTEDERTRIESFCKDVRGERYEPLARLFAQFWFNAPVFRTAEEQTRGGGRAYCYYFTAESAVPMLKSGHGVEVSTIFNNLDDLTDTGRVFDLTFSRNLRRIWIQFAKTGNPSLSAEQSADGKEKEFPVYDPANRYVIVLDESNIHTEKEAALKIVDWDRTYFLTNYYVLG